MPRRKYYICKVEGCENKRYAKGFCRPHYNQMKKSKKIKEHFRNDKNVYEMFEDYALMETYDRNGKVTSKAIVDLDDVPKLKKHKWWKTKYGYIATTITNRKNKTKSNLFLHRYIMKCPRNMVVDHINHNTIDNRKSNLRVCTQKENMNNLKRKAKNISIVRRNENIYYIVQFKGKYIGCFKRIDDAQNKVRELYRLDTKMA